MEAKEQILFDCLLQNESVRSVCTAIQFSLGDILYLCHIASREGCGWMLPPLRGRFDGNHITGFSSLTHPQFKLSSAVIVLRKKAAICYESYHALYQM